MTLVTGAHVDEKVASLLQQMGHRYSTVRRRLVSVLRTAGKPLTSSQITDSDDSLVQSSVYRNLNVLEEAGAVTRITTNDEFTRYELAERITEHHHHIICTRCGDIADFSLPSSVEKSLNLSLRKAANKVSFNIDNHRLDALGTCVSCQ
ncbi:MAG: Fur family transcriptional regulator [Actinomycetota bacterium]|nr:Fur family transcriptional regulator [Actinomycetota bacterium]|tara:strand:- start:177 stop:623 length:447 start_codon:yes stop_codon:yes gene_type:complete